MKSAIYLLLALSVTQASGQVPQLTETTAQNEQRLQWFRDAKFGLFIHWGPAALSGAEISWGMKDRIERGESLQRVPRDEYMNLYREFNPVNFDADEIMALAKNAGMTYSVFVTKHHDGFSLWETEQKHFPASSAYPEHYSIADTPYTKDIVKQVRDAALKQDMKVGWYYSTRDWTHPEYLQGDNLAYNDYYENQVEELLSDYGPVDILWFDHCFGAWDQYTIPRLYEKMYAHNPDLLVNNRAARGLSDIPKASAPLKYGDYDTPENRMGSFQAGRAWESCMILSPHTDHGGWSYRPGAVTRSLTETIRLLSSCVTGDGNMLLNIAPLPDGSLRAEERAVLEGLAPWMETHGEAIYATRGGPWINGTWGGATYQGNQVYLHLFEPDEDGIELNRLPQRVLQATTMDGKPVPFQQTAETLKVTVPADLRDEHVTVIRLTLDQVSDGVQYGAALANGQAQAVPGTLVFTAEAAAIHGSAVVRGTGTSAAIVEWAEQSTTISWPLELNSPGTYRVEMDVATPQIDSAIRLSVGNGRGLHVHLPVTGAMDQYQTVQVGELTFANAETLELVLQPYGHLEWLPISVRAIRLIPSN